MAKWLILAPLLVMACNVLDATKRSRTISMSNAIPITRMGLRDPRFVERVRRAVTIGSNRQLMLGRIIKGTSQTVSGIRQIVAVLMRNGAPCTVDFLMSAAPEPEDVNINCD